MNILLYLVILCTVAYTSAKGLPTYIKKCSISSTDFDTCFVKHANDAIPYLLKGDKKFNLPSFNPLKLDEIQFNPTNNLKITFTNIKTRGFDEAEVLSGHYNRTSKEFSYKIKIPNFDVKSNYKAKGTILILPFHGNGTDHIQLKNLTYTHTFQVDPSDMSSKNFLKLVNSSVEYHVDKTKYQFDNLFNGNKELGDSLNLFLNENEADLTKDFQPVFKETINSVSIKVINQLLKKMTFADLFSP